ncbi:Small ribosomal subunit protein mS23 [Exophiala dermatitidis]
MGRINLTAVNVRRTALAKLKTRQIPTKPSWLDITGDVPPAQILVRQQPLQHHFTKVRTRSLPNGKTEQYVQVVEPKKRKTLKDRHLFMPKKLQYEEDSLRSRFFSDHPWELARPRVVLETSGDQYKNADWSTGLVQPGVPLSGESVVQRQLWLLGNVPDITVAQAYDIARKEFYTLRRQEETRNRIAAEEARHMGAQFGKSAIQISMQIENQMYNDWERWSRQQVAEQTQRAAAFEGTISKVEDQSLKEVAQVEGEGERPAIGAGVFAQQQKLDSRNLRRSVNPAQQQVKAQI